jgi:hypothetical protein
MKTIEVDGKLIILYELWYEPSQSYEYYDYANKQWYNSLGQKLKDPIEYNLN